ncbi:DUF2164 domain-containing protein [Neptuniibacter caesariensis]|uniref:DUF2164 domain-containing protein n=1 Tax=Neptuniibacter caesariensis TaxID=207954 RepID=A0A7U8C8W5_NEPCE|nr:DUF2164 domain-containing protein [Neptuniibacter caesariensis]EAR62289.1 hypothetical protein MED92_14668 [Oceanospirillum sp. MED92] [Neptuniibacter caesariensis]
MSDIKLSTDETDRIVSKIKTYFRDELDQDIGGFEAEFLIDFFAKEIGPHFYNQGLADANRVFTEKAEDIGYLIQEMEKPTF